MHFLKISLLFPTERLEIFWGKGGGFMRGSLRPKIVKKTMKLNWNFQRGGETDQITSVGKVWIFSGTTQCQVNN